MTRSVAGQERRPTRVIARVRASGPRARALSVALSYAVIATAWILLSDRALGAFVAEDDLVSWSVAKGLVFVAVTSLVLLWLMRRWFGALQATLDTATAHEAEVHRLRRLYAALSHIDQAIVWAPTRDDLLRKICSVLVEHGEFRMAWIGWNDPETAKLVPVAVEGDERGYVTSVTVYTDDRPEGRGPSGNAFREGRPYVSNDRLTDAISRPWRAQSVASGLLSSACIPIRLDGEVCATLNVYADEVGFFQDKEVALLTEAAVDISFGLDNLARDEERAQAQAVAHSERLFSDTMIESMPGILYLYDEHGRFLRWNKNFEIAVRVLRRRDRAMHPLDFFERPTRARCGNASPRCSSRVSRTSRRRSCTATARPRRTSSPAAGSSSTARCAWSASASTSPSEPRRRLRCEPASSAIAPRWTASSRRARSSASTGATSTSTRRRRRRTGARTPSCSGARCTKRGRASKPAMCSSRSLGA